MAITIGLFASVFLFSPSVLAEETDAAITAALEDLGAAVGQTVSSKDQAVAICDSEKYFEICAKVGREHNLYTSEEVKQVDTFITEIRGALADQLKNCQTTECLLGVANELAKKVSAKDSKLAESFELTATFVAKKQAVISAAKEAGVDYDTCRNMDPDTAEINTLRACARLAKDNRVRDIIPEAARAQAEKYGEYADKSVELRVSLQSGEFQCGDGTLDGCGDFCLNPNATDRAQGASVIPPVCRQIAEKFFGADGVKHLEDSHSQVNQVKDYHKKKADNIIFTTLDGRTLSNPEEIGRYMEEQGRTGNVEAVEKGMDFMISKGFVNPEEKEFVLKYVKQARDQGGNIDFDKCAQDPRSCQQFIPDDQRGEFEAQVQLQESLQQELGFNPRDCRNAVNDQALGQKCWEASKKVLPRIEALSTQASSPELQRFVREIKQNVSRTDDFYQRKEGFQQAFQQQGGPGGCRSEQDCSTYCSDSAHGPECIAFGAKQGVAGFRGEEAVDKYQQYNNTLQRPQYGNQGYPLPLPGVFPGQGNQQGFPGQGYPVQGGFPGGGPAGPSPECFAAIKAGDFAKAKLACESHVANPEPIRSICPALYSVESCPVGEIKVVSYSSPECGVYYSCQKEYRGEVTALPYPSYSPYPTYSYTPYPTGGDGRYCPPPSYWDESIRGCRSGGSYSPYPTSGGSWINKTWKFKDGSSQSSSILSRTDSEYVNYITGIYNDCASKYFSGWKSGSGDQSNWQEFGVPTCSTTPSQQPTYSPWPSSSYSPYPTSTGTGGLYSCFYPNASRSGQPTGYTVWCEKDYFNCHEGSKTGSSISLDGLSLGAPSSCEGGWQTSPYPTTSYTPYPSGTPTSSGSCPSGAHTMYVNGAGGYCMSDADTSKCGPLNSSSTGSFGSCSTYQGSTNTPTNDYGSCGTATSQSSCTAISNCYWYSGTNPYCYYSSTPPASTYTPYPTTSGGSCVSGSHSMGSYCMSDADGTKCGAFGSSVSSFGSCNTYQTSTSPYPTTSYTYTPYPTCSSGQWWDSSTSSCKTTTTSDTPAPTTDPATSCASTGGSWDGSSCVYPTATPATPEPTPEPTPPTSGFSPQHQMAMANTIMACADSGGTWNASNSSCSSSSFAKSFFGNIIKIFSRFLQ